MAFILTPQPLPQQRPFFVPVTDYASSSISSISSATSNSLASLTSVSMSSSLSSYSVVASSHSHTQSSPHPSAWSSVSNSVFHSGAPGLSVDGSIPTMLVHVPYARIMTPSPHFSHAHPLSSDLEILSTSTNASGFPIPYSYHHSHRHSLNPTSSSSHLLQDRDSESRAFKKEKVVETVPEKEKDPPKKLEVAEPPKNIGRPPQSKKKPKVTKKQSKPKTLATDDPENEVESNEKFSGSNSEQGSSPSPSSRSGKGYPVGRFILSDNRRAKKNTRERQRRQELNHQFDKLCSLLKLERHKMRKTYLLSKANHFIESLIKENQSLRQKLSLPFQPFPILALPQGADEGSLHSDHNESAGSGTEPDYDPDDTVSRPHNSNSNANSKNSNNLPRSASFGSNSGFHPLKPQPQRGIPPRIEPRRHPLSPRHENLDPSMPSLISPRFFRNSSENKDPEESSSRTSDRLSPSSHHTSERREREKNNDDRPRRSRSPKREEETEDDGKSDLDKLLDACNSLSPRSFRPNVKYEERERDVRSSDHGTDSLSEEDSPNIDDRDSEISRKRSSSSSKNRSFRKKSKRSRRSLDWVN